MPFFVIFNRIVLIKFFLNESNWFRCLQSISSDFLFFNQFEMKFDFEQLQVCSNCWFHQQNYFSHQKSSKRSLAATVPSTLGNKMCAKVAKTISNWHIKKCRGKKAMTFTWWDQVLIWFETKLIDFLSVQMWSPFLILHPLIYPF